ncbi:MAG: hypothetical protein J1E99_00485 [Muribaculaceae bacterium]|nr:hypothetical protein [Muribaculaceae bacterium]
MPFSLSPVATSLPGLSRCKTPADFPEIENGFDQWPNKEIADKKKN